MSRLVAVCKSCTLRDARTGFYRERPGCVPAFDDVCPRCGSENVDVIDTVAQARTARADSALG